MCWMLGERIPCLAERSRSLWKFDTGCLKRISLDSLLFYSIERDKCDEDAVCSAQTYRYQCRARELLHDKIGIVVD